MQRLTLVLLSSAAMVALSACTAVQTQRGFVPPEPTALDNIIVGEDTRVSVTQKLGSPTLSGTFDQNTWYYVSSYDVQAAFFPTQTTERSIVAVGFSPEGQVASVERYGLEDGRIVDYVDRETPTRGREMTILQQIFNAVPGNIGGNQGQIPGQNPGGGTGAPPPF
jgi:outer membrane protein assembly factor BamE (lipoprotein component of BamABCDE complex)